ncbi:MAG TPA: Imm1 family immunity protein [Pseudonocardiaceae bacterium]|nr:Imm1 family immunity protein [Pseudonocardiaceae bacterium]
MTLEAGWAVVPADGVYRGFNIVVETPDDVHELVRRLTEPGAEIARLIHHGRPLWDADRGFVDHDVYAAVADGFGYLSFQDARRTKRYPLGADGSPGCEFDDDEFPPGSGLPLDRFAEAITEFLLTADLPTGVRWQAVGTPGWAGSGENPAPAE